MSIIHDALEDVRAWSEDHLGFISEVATALRKGWDAGAAKRKEAVRDEAWGEGGLYRDGCTEGSGVREDEVERRRLAARTRAGLQLRSAEELAAAVKRKNGAATAAPKERTESLESPTKAATDEQVALLRPATYLERASLDAGDYNGAVSACLDEGVARDIVDAVVLKHAKMHRGYSAGWFIVPQEHLADQIRALVKHFKGMVPRVGAYATGAGRAKEALSIVNVVHPNLIRPLLQELNQDGSFSLRLRTLVLDPGGEPVAAVVKHTLACFLLRQAINPELDKKYWPKAWYPEDAVEREFIKALRNPHLVQCKEYIDAEHLKRYLLAEQYGLRTFRPGSWKNMTDRLSKRNLLQSVGPGRYKALT